MAKNNHHSFPANFFPGRGRGKKKKSLLGRGGRVFICSREKKKKKEGILFFISSIPGRDPPFNKSDP